MAPDTLQLDFETLLQLADAALIAIEKAVAAKVLNEQNGRLAS
jgi:hypothetical protein